MNVEIKYLLVLDLFNGRPNVYDPESFNSIEEATQHWRIHYQNRNKGDGYDEKWRKVPLRIQQVIKTNLWEK